MSFLVFDIETVPDLKVWQPSAPEPPKLSDEKKPGKADLEFLTLALSKDLPKLHPKDLEKAKDIAERSGKEDEVAKIDTVLKLLVSEENEFPPLYAHRPVAVAGVLFDDSYNVKWMGVANAPTEEFEKPLLSSWASFLTSERPDVVTWNGRRFDVPVILLRSFRHGVAHPWYTQEHQKRYSSEGHLDLADVMTEYGSISGKFLKLDDVAKLIGLPGKMGMDGSQVAKLYAEGKIDQIAAYCFTDAVQTAFVFLRFMLTRGRIALDTYRMAVYALFGACRNEVSLTELLGRINTQALTLE